MGRTLTARLEVSASSGVVPSCLLVSGTRRNGLGENLFGDHRRLVRSPTLQFFSPSTCVLNSQSLLIIINLISCKCKVPTISPVYITAPPLLSNHPVCYNTYTPTTIHTYNNRKNKQIVYAMRPRIRIKCSKVHSMHAMLRIPSPLPREIKTRKFNSHTRNHNLIHNQ
jgi:hypothetical protein